MFGYIRIRKEDLLIRDYRIYKQKYCSLCHILGKRYGFIYRSIISYDIIFLLLVLENYYEDNVSLSFRCPINPLNKMKSKISEQVVDYCAFVNYYLAVQKLEDDVVDENRFVTKILLKIFKYNFKYRKKVDAYRGQLEKLSKLMNQVNELEKINATFDEITNSFGEYFTEIFRVFFELYGQEQPLSRHNSLYTLCFNLGKWIYLMDAYDDYYEDIKKKSFNLLNGLVQEDSLLEKLKTHQKIAIIQEMLMFNIKDSFYKTNWNKNKHILYNIIAFGCRDTYLGILHKRYPQIESAVLTEYLDTK